MRQKNNLFFILLLLSYSGISLADSHNSCNSNCSTDCNSCEKVCDVDCCKDLLQNSGNIYGKTAYVPRAQGENSARRVMGIQEKIHKFGSDGFYGVATAAFEYQRTFKDQSNIGKWFSTNGEGSMSYGVIDSVASNTQYDINALNFGVTGSGTIKFCPCKEDYIFDLFAYFGLDNLFCGLWAAIDIPIVHTKWDLGLTENVTGSGSSSLPSGVYTTASGDLSAPFATSDTPMTDAFAGGSTSAFGQVAELKKGKICGQRSATNVSGIRIDVGYDWFRRERWHLASSWQFVAPVGTTPSADYLFQPLVGDYKRAQFGSTWNFWKEIWSNCDATSSLNFYLYGTLNAIFKKRMERLLGLKVSGVSAENEVWTQYLTLKKFTKSGDTFTYANEIERAANLTAGCIKVHATALIDLVAMLQWDCSSGMFAGLGYEFWFRSKEVIDERCFSIAENTYAVQGVQPVDDNATRVDPKARINYVNYSSDGTNASGATAPTVSTTNTISNDDLDYCRALAPSMLSNKIFGFIGYNWNNCDYWTPFLLLGGSVEFGQDNRTWDQWGVIVKGGLAF